MAGEASFEAEIQALDRLPGWDTRIEAYPQKRIFHESAWLRLLEAEEGGAAVVVRITDVEGRERALWPGLVIRRGPIRVFGSPLRGWGTVSMGPLYADAQPAPLLEAAEKAFSRAGVLHWEFVSETLPPEGAAGMGFRLESSDTHRIPLDSDEDKMWAHLQQRCRTSTRKALKSGLSSRLAPDAGFLEPLYRMVEAVFSRHGTTPSYSAERLRRLWDSLFPRGKAFGIEIRRGEETVAAGLFITDGRQAYAWAEASDARFNALAPNNLLYWEAMRRSAALGAACLHLPGAPGSNIGRFKASFNPEVLRYPFWIRDRSRVLAWGRWLYRELVEARRKWRYLRHRGSRRRAGPERSWA